MLQIFYSTCNCVHKPMSVIATLFFCVTKYKNFNGAFTSPFEMEFWGIHFVPTEKLSGLWQSLYTNHANQLKIRSLAFLGATFVT